MNSIIIIIIHSLEDNHSLQQLRLSDKSRSKYFSESEQALDDRIHFEENLVACMHNNYKLLYYIFRYSPPLIKF